MAKVRLQYSYTLLIDSIKSILKEVKSNELIYSSALRLSL